MAFIVATTLRRFSWSFRLGGSIMLNALEAANKIFGKD